MSYSEKDNPYKRSWNSGSTVGHMTPGILNTLTPMPPGFYEKAQENLEKLENAIRKEEEWKLTHPSFSEEQHVELLKNGYEVFKLRGFTLKKIIEAKHVLRRWNTGLAFEEEKSMESEAAIPKYFVGLRDCENKTLDQQLELFKKFKRKMERQIPGVTAKVGNVADYAELELRYKENHNGKGFMYWYENGGIRTLNEYDRTYLAAINAPYNYSYTFNIWPTLREDKSKYLVLAPILIPTGSHWKKE